MKLMEDTWTSLTSTVNVNSKNGTNKDETTSSISTNIKKIKFLKKLR